MTYNIGFPAHFYGDMQEHLVKIEGMLGCIYFTKTRRKRTVMLLLSKSRSSTVGNNWVTSREERFREGLLSDISDVSMWS